MNINTLDSMTSFNGRNNFRSFLDPKKSALSTMRIECCNRQSRPFETPTL